MKELNKELKKIGFSDEYLRIINKSKNIEIKEKKFENSNFPTFDNQIITSSTAYYEPQNDMELNF